MDKIYKFLIVVCIIVLEITCFAAQARDNKIKELENQTNQYEERIKDLEESSREVVQMLTILDEKVEVQNNVFNAHLTGELSKDWGGE